MHKPTDAVLDDDYESNLDSCVDELQRILESAKKKQKENPKNSEQEQKPSKDSFTSTVNELINQTRSGTSDISNRLFSRKKKNSLADHIGPRARLKGVKTPPPKKRGCDSEQCESPCGSSPHVHVKWASPVKPSFAEFEGKRNRSVRNLSDELEATENPIEKNSIVTMESNKFSQPINGGFGPVEEQEQDHDVEVKDHFKASKKEKKHSASDIGDPESPGLLESFVEKYSRGHSPSPVRDKSPRVSPRVNIEIEGSASILGKPLSHNLSSGLFGSPLVIASPQVSRPPKKKSPLVVKTQIVSSEDYSAPELKANENPLYETLATLNNQYITIIEEERRNLSHLLQHCKALIPQNINLDAPESSLSTWMTKDLLNLLSLSSLRQITQLITNTISSMEKLKTAILHTDMGIAEDQKLQSIYSKLNMSVRIAIDQDIQYLELITRSLNNYEKDTLFFTTYFANTDDETKTFQLLHQLLEHSHAIDKDYLEKNPTLVRRLVQESFKYLNQVPSASTRIEFLTITIPQLKAHLTSLVNAYEIEKNQMQQARQCVF